MAVQHMKYIYVFSVEGTGKAAGRLIVTCERSAVRLNVFLACSDQ